MVETWVDPKQMSGQRQDTIGPLVYLSMGPFQPSTICIVYLVNIPAIIYEGVS